MFKGKKKSSFKCLPAGGVQQNVIDSADFYGLKALGKLEETICNYQVIPHIDEEFTSPKYEQHAVEKYIKWAEFINENAKFRALKLFVFRVHILFVFFVLTPFISRKGKK